MNANKVFATLLAVATLSASATALADTGYAPEFKTPHGELNVQAVHYTGVRPAAKDDDRIQFIAVDHAQHNDSAYQPLRRTTSR